MHLDAVDRVVAHLDGEQRRLLLVEDVPGVEHSVLASDVKRSIGFTTGFHYHGKGPHLRHY